MALIRTFSRLPASGMVVFFWRMCSTPCHNGYWSLKVATDALDGSGEFVWVMVVWRMSKSNALSILWLLSDALSFMKNQTKGVQPVSLVSLESAESSTTVKRTTGGRSTNVCKCCKHFVQCLVDRDVAVFLAPNCRIGEEVVYCEEPQHD